MLIVLYYAYKICNTYNIDTAGATKDLYGVTTGGKKKF